MVRKNPKVEIKAKYAKTFEIALITSLSLMIVAFKFFPEVEGPKSTEILPQETIRLEDIESTRQEQKPPPPPLPQIPIEAPGEVVLEDELIIDTEIRLTEEIRPSTSKDGEIEIFYVVEDDPEPIGGLAAIQAHVVYPEIARRAGVEGMVYLEVFVDEYGNVARATVTKGIGAGCDEAAVIAIQKVKFKPGLQRGVPVKARMSIPIRFRLQK